jgi:hypothetical protein
MAFLGIVSIHFRTEELLRPLKRLYDQSSFADNDRYNKSGGVKS